MFPEMLAEPSRTHRPHRIGTGILILPEISHRSGVSPDIQVVVAHPSVKSIDFPGCFPSILCCPADQVKERFLTFAQVASLSHPVIHLRVDINGIITAPGGTHPVVPDSLEVCTLASRSGGTDHQVSGIMEHHLCQTVFPGVVQ